MRRWNIHLQFPNLTFGRLHKYLGLSKVSPEGRFAKIPECAVEEKYDKRLFRNVIRGISSCSLWGKPQKTSLIFLKACINYLFQWQIILQIHCFCWRCAFGGCLEGVSELSGGLSMHCPLCKKQNGRLQQILKEFVWA